VFKGMVYGAMATRAAPRTPASWAVFRQSCTGRTWRLLSHCRHRKVLAVSILSVPIFHDEPAAVAKLESTIWPNGPVCPLRRYQADRQLYT